MGGVAHEWEKVIESLPPEQRKWADAVCDLGGTCDGDWGIFRAAAILLAQEEAKAA